MGDMDPVSWETIEAVVGPPASEVEAYVERMREEVRREEPYDAVKAVHDALKRDLGEERSPAGQAEVFLVAYLLERDGVVSSDEWGTEDGFAFPSVAERRPDGDRLRELFWGRERTMWWLGIRLGVHWALVRYWLYEESIPLRERNFPAEVMAEIRAYRRREE